MANTNREELDSLKSLRLGERLYQCEDLYGAGMRFTISPVPSHPTPFYHSHSSTPMFLHSKHLRTGSAPSIPYPIESLSHRSPVVPHAIKLLQSICQGDPLPLCQPSCESREQYTPNRHTLYLYIIILSSSARLRNHAYRPPTSSHRAQ